VLFPWSLHLLTRPSAFLSEAGLSAQGLTTRGLSPGALLALSPGGPGLPPLWVTIGLGLALLALVLPVSRTGLVIAGWAVAVAGILTAVLVSRVSVTPPAGGQPADGWPGVAMALAALGLLLASAPAAQWLVGIIQNDSGRLAAGTSSPVAGHGRSRRALACVALAAAATAPLLVAGYWDRDGVRGPVGTITAPLLPAFVSASSTSGEQYRTLILRPDGAGLDYLVVRQADPTLGEPELGTASSAGAALSRQVAALGAPDGADAGDPGLVLGSFGIRWVLLPGPVNPVLAQRLDASLGLVALNKGASYDLWQVTGPVARVRVVAADGTTTDLSSATVNMSGVTAPASGGTLVLAEPYGGWTATLNGRALKPVATPVNGWAQGFVLPAGGGQLSITRNNLARGLSLFLELIATLAICLLALPGKRVDPVREAEALTALREARNGKRAANSARRATRSVRAEGAGHRAVGAVDRLGSRFAVRRRAGQEQPDEETASDEVLADQAATDQVPAGRVPGGKAPAGRAPAAGEATGAELTEPAGPEAVTTVRLADPGQGRHGRHSRLAEDDRDGGAPSAPWDMAGDWDSPGRTGASDAWAADPLDTSKPLKGRGRRDDPARPTGQQAAAPERRGAARPAPESPVLGTPVPQNRPGRQNPVPQNQPVPRTRPVPPESGPQRPPWESGPQVPVPSTGTQPRYPRESGPQPPVTPTGSQPASRPATQPSFTPTGSQPVSGPAAQPGSRTGALPVFRTGAQPASGTGAQPASPAGGQPASRPGAQPVPPTETQPVERAPWESGDWGKAPDWDAVPGSRDTGIAASEPEPGAATGSGAWPTAGRPASQERPAKQERHSHRAAKHGRPSRWRGSGNRSTGDGES